VRRAGLFVAEGDKLAERLLHSELRVHSLLLSEEFAKAGALRIPPEVTTFVAPDALLREIVGFKFHRGVMACGFRAPRRTLLSIDGLTPNAAAWLDDSHQGDATTTAIVCVDIQDPTNLGTILRTAEAFGVAAVLLGPGCADPFSRRVLRVSMGAPFQLPIVCSTDLAEDLNMLRQCCQMTLLAALASPAADSLEQLQRPNPNRLAILLGNESRGLDHRWIEMCDRSVTIPMHPQADSLNVAVATGILLYYFCGNGATNVTR
jgi:tRNA G18 (ribose-2'-O)-methylase SpoU